MNKHQEAALDAVLKEIKAQEEWRGTQNHGDITWAQFLMETAGELMAQIFNGVERRRAALEKIAAVTILWLECTHRGEEAPAVMWERPVAYANVRIMEALRVSAKAEIEAAIKASGWKPKKEG